MSGRRIPPRHRHLGLGITLFIVLAEHVGDSVVDGWNVAVLVAAAVSLLGAVAIVVLSRAAPSRMGR